MQKKEDKQYYIFPHNYDETGRFLGLIEYRTLILITIWFAITIGLYYVLPIPLHIKIYGFIFTFFPPALFLLIGINGDNVIDFSKYFLKFNKNAKVYVFNKEDILEEESNYAK